MTSVVGQALKDNGYLVHSITGVSMIPMLRQSQDAVHLVPAQGRLSRDQIALYQRANGSIVLHRVVKVIPEGYIIRGDNCIDNELVLEEQIIGVAQGVYRDGQYYSCQNKAIARFAARQRWTLPYRRLRAFLAKVKRKLSKIIAKNQHKILDK